MTLRLNKNGMDVPPLTAAETELARLCLEQDLSVVMEWLDGQWRLHSDLPKERPIGIEIDRELDRHLSYFKKSSVHKELLARAIGIKGAYRPRVVDMTAGLLGDTLLFLSMGCRVTAVERHPLAAVLIESALGRARHPLLASLQFQRAEAAQLLRSPVEGDVIFFDPMFEDSNEKALPRKEMRIFRAFIQEDLDSPEVLGLALKQEIKRVVVKRPRHSQTLLPGRPLQYMGKATRYDVYL